MNTAGTLPPEETSGSDSPFDAVIPDSSISKRDQLWVLRRCGKKGHELAWLADPLAPTFEGEDNNDQALLRCLRCGTFLPATATTVTNVHGSEADPVALSELPLVLRGAHGRKLALLRVLAIERAFRGLGLWIAAITVFALGAYRDTVITKTDALIESAGPLAKQIGWDMAHSHTLEMIRSFLGSSQTAYTIVGIGLVLYGLIQMVEAFGLWGGWRWAEYLAAIATSAFLPLEFYEIAHHPTPLKMALVAANILIVAYIIYKGRLFGVRGGHPRYLQEIRETTLLGEELAAVGRSPEEQTGEELV